MSETTSQPAEDPTTDPTLDEPATPAESAKEPEEVTVEPTDTTSGAVAPPETGPGKTDDAPEPPADGAQGTDADTAHDSVPAELPGDTQGYIAAGNEKAQAKLGDEGGLSNKAAAARRHAEAAAEAAVDTTNLTTLNAVPTPATIEDPQGIERIVGAPQDDWVRPPLEADPKEVARLEALAKVQEAKKQERLAQLQDRADQES